MHLRRRALLAAAATATTAALTGCDLGENPKDPPFDPTGDALMPLLTRAVALRDRYGEALTAFPALQDRLGPLKDDHEQHVVALAREIGLPERGPFPAASGSAAAPPSAGPLPGDQAAALAELAKLEKDGRQDAETACLAAPSYRAALLGSIAACRAGHAEVLA
ncbi:hypothetical protein ACQP1P_07480 [Dactylosporangium sp. CA-052675]|uniref:hypothetical protein n=1 Tax=Dactylosporangium sp. CA-052675 TaxID=3239927 RepID=UPI003D8B55E5